MVPSLLNVGNGVVTGTLNIRPGTGMTNPPLVTTTFTIQPNSSVGQITLPTAVAFSPAMSTPLRCSRTPTTICDGSARSAMLSGGTSRRHLRRSPTRMTTTSGPSSPPSRHLVPTPSAAICGHGTSPPRAPRPWASRTLGQFVTNEATVNGALTTASAVVNGPLSAADANVSGQFGVGTTQPTAQLQVQAPACPPAPGPRHQRRCRQRRVPHQRHAGQRRGVLRGLQFDQQPQLRACRVPAEWTAVSDARLKSDVSPAEGLLDAALKLRPVTFRWNADGSKDTGLIAQESPGCPAVVRGGR